MLAAIDDQWAKAVTTILEPAFAPDIEPLERIDALADQALSLVAGTRLESA